MAERIVSPGVFTREKDLSFLPQGIGEIGAALIGQTVKGPAFVPTQVETFQEFQQVFGGLTEESFLPYTAQAYLEDAGVATIVRVLGASGYTLENPIALQISSSNGQKVAAVLHPTHNIVSDVDVFNQSFVRDLNNGDTSVNVTASLFGIVVSGSEVTPSENFTASLNPTNTNYFTKTFGFSPKGNQKAYTYANFKTFQSASFAAQTSLNATAPFSSSVVTVQHLTGSDIDYGQQYQEASTPYIVSQAVGGSTTNLFKVKTLSHGTSTNFEFKIGIQDIKAAGTIAGSEYGSFSLVVRRVDQDKINNSPYVGVTDSDIRPNIVETFQGLNLDPDSPNYIARRIGDNFITVDADGKLTQNGDYPNLSKNIRVEMESVVNNKGISPDLVPFGFAALVNPFGNKFTLPEPTYVSTQKINNIYNPKKFFGLDYDFSTTDNLAFLSPTPSSNPDSMTTAFSLSNFNQEAGANFPTSATAYSGSIDLTTNTALASKKFLVPFQGGFDGFKPSRVVKFGKDIIAGNTQGFDCSSATAAGTIAYRKAINAVSNPDEFDINMLVIPGLIHRLHSSVTTFAKDMVEERQDAFFVMDSSAYDDNISTVVNTVQSFDSNYVATYYPWVKILDTDKNKEVWVTPSVVIPGVIAFNDSVAESWFAPAGLNRGGLTNVTQAKTRLTRAERDDLYEGRVNPIASFPGQGVTVLDRKHYKLNHRHWIESM